MTPETFRTVVRRYLVWGFYGLAVLEAAAFVLRAFGVDVPLVSQVARDQAFGRGTADLAWYDRPASSLVYAWAGMAGHWFVTWRRLVLSGWWARVLGVLFWLALAAYLLSDILDPAPTYWPVLTQWLRYPPLVALEAGVLAVFWFGQRSRWTPGEATT